MPHLKTARLILRQWQERDLEPFATLNADPRVREFFPGLMSRQESDVRPYCKVRMGILGGFTH